MKTSASLNHLNEFIDESKEGITMKIQYIFSSLKENYAFIFTRQEVHMRD